MANTFKFGNGNWAVKKDSVLAYNDENNNFKPLPFDFTRDTIGTYVDSDGLIKTAVNNEARIDYLDNADGALLLEPARTNLLTYSSELNIGTSGAASVTSNTTISPDGTLNADTLGAGYLSKSLSAAANTYTLSVFVKAEILSTARIFIYDGTYYNGTYDLTTGISTGVGTSMVNYGNGWWRCIITQATTSTISEIGFNSGQVYGYGFQLEQGSYATSYIPTNGSSVTRAAESCNGAGNNQVIASNEGVLYFEGSALADDANNKQMSLNDSGSNTVRLLYNANNVRAFVQVSASTVVDITHAITNAKNVIKVALKYKINDYALWVNGVKVGVDTNASTFPANTLDNFSFNDGVSSDFYSKIKEIKVYNTALSDSELQALTQV